MDNHMGAVTKVAYAPSTRYYLDDRKSRTTHWRTHLPFPVHVVDRVETIDEVSNGKLTSEYCYHHGYWDGREREFRGFAMVEQFDSETFEAYHAPDPLHAQKDFERFDQTPERARQFSPPTLTRTWFHVGALDEATDGLELNLSHEYFEGDPALLNHKPAIDAFLAGLPTLQARRDALRALRGNVLRTELFARDGERGRQDRPYSVTECAYALREVASELLSGEDRRDPSLVFFPFVVAHRTTQWERGDDPMTQFVFVGDYDALGQPQQHTTVAMPRRAAKRTTLVGTGGGDLDEPRVLASHIRTRYAKSASGAYLHDRIAQAKTYTLSRPPSGPDDAVDDAVTALRKQWVEASRINAVFKTLQADSINVIAHVVNHYDGPAFQGMETSELDRYGVLARSEALVLTEAILNDSYASPDPISDPRHPNYLGGTAMLPTNSPALTAVGLGYALRSADARLGYEAGYYVDTLRRQLDVQISGSTPPRGLVVAMQDALKQETAIEYDRFRFLTAKVTNPAGLEVRAEHDYRALQPKIIIDLNGNRSHMRYSPHGLPLKLFLRSRDDSQGGDDANPDVAFLYDFRAFAARREPISVRTRRRVHHASDALSDETIDTYEYSDGFGRLLQSRTQAEDVIFGGVFGNGILSPAQGDPLERGAIAGVRNANHARPNVVVSGRQVYDNKGRVVEKFEPYFDVGWTYQAPTRDQLGQRVRMFYDPRGQLNSHR